MRRAVIVAGILIQFLTGCSYFGLQSPFGEKDPLTGGVDASQSGLLGVRTPSGFQIYPSHGYSAPGSSGKRKGLETWRGYVNETNASLSMFNTLKKAGWQLRSDGRMGHRSLQIYEKKGELAALTFHKQGMLTIMEIWLGPKLPNGSKLDLPSGNNPEETPSLAGEEFGPIEESEGAKIPDRAIETWGGSGVKEKEL